MVSRVLVKNLKHYEKRIIYSSERDDTCGNTENVCWYLQSHCYSFHIRYYELFNTRLNTPTTLTNLTWWCRDFISQCIYMYHAVIIGGIAMEMRNHGCQKWNNAIMRNVMNQISMLYRKWHHNQPCKSHPHLFSLKRTLIVWLNSSSYFIVFAIKSQLSIFKVCILNMSIHDPYIT